MARKERRVHRVAGGVEPLAEISQRLRGVARSVEQQQRAAGCAHKYEALRSLRNPLCIHRKPLGVFPLDGARHATAVEGTGDDGGNRSEQQQGDQAKPLTRAGSVAPHRLIHFQAPPIDSAHEIQHFAEALITQPVRGGRALHAVMAIDDNLRVTIK